MHSRLIARGAAFGGRCFWVGLVLIAVMAASVWGRMKRPRTT